MGSVFQSFELSVLQSFNFHSIKVGPGHGSRQYVDKEEGAETKQLDQITGQDHGREHDGGDEGDVEVVDGVAVAFATDIVDEGHDGVEPEAKKKLCGEGSHTQHHQRLRRAIGHQQIDDGGEGEEEEPCVLSLEFRAVGLRLFGVIAMCCHFRAFYAILGTESPS